MAFLSTVLDLKHFRFSILFIASLVLAFFLLAGLYTTFIFQKPDPDIAPPLATPLLQDTSYTHDEASTFNENKKGKRTIKSIVV